MLTGTFASVGIGFLLGVRHALDADHIVAVSTVVSQHRSIARSSLIGTFWGLGHTTALLVIGIAVIAFGITLSPRFAMWAEGAVACMLILLGVDLLREVLAINPPEVSDGEGMPSRVGFGGKSFLIGLIHGASGSAAIMLLVLTTIPSPFHGVMYVLLFGMGSIGGMIVMSVLLGLPMSMTQWRAETVHTGYKIGAGALSLGFGMYLAWTISRSAELW